MKLAPVTPVKLKIEALVVLGSLREPPSPFERHSEEHTAGAGVSTEMAGRAHQGHSGYFQRQGGFDQSNSFTISGCTNSKRSEWIKQRGFQHCLLSMWWDNNEDVAGARPLWSCCRSCIIKRYSGLLFFSGTRWPKEFRKKRLHRAVVNLSSFSCSMEKSII